MVAAFRARGMTVHALARSSDALDAVGAELGAETHGVDLSDVAALEETVARLDVDVVVNNAGVLPELAPFHEVAPDTIDASLDVNVRAAMHVTRLTLPKLVERNRGHVVFIGSIAAKRPSPNLAVYSATKAALHAFADCLKADLLGTDVRVTVVAPGRVRTSLYDGIYGGESEAEQALYDGVNPVSPEDVATAVLTAIDMPPNVDVTTIEVLPTRQVYGGTLLARDE